MNMLKAVFILTLISLVFSAGCSQQNETKEVNPLQIETNYFVGRIIEINDGMDGLTVVLHNRDMSRKLVATLSAPNLGTSSEFDFSHIQIGNTLKVRGEIYYMNDSAHMTVKKAYSYVPIKGDSSKLTKKQSSLCQRIGGQVEKTGKAQYESCKQTYADANEPCINHSECLGRCVISESINSSLQVGQYAKGECESNNIRFGCMGLIENGTFEGIICID